MAEELRGFTLPDLGEGLADAEIVQWLVKPGDVVALNQPIVEVETEKAIVEIPSPFAGVVHEVIGEVGQRMAVGSTILKVLTEADPPPGPVARTEVLVGYGPEEGVGNRRRRTRVGRRDAVGSVEQRPRVTAKTLATPPVRKLAHDLGVALESVRGSGRDGRVTRDDILSASRVPAAVPTREAELVPAVSPTPKSPRSEPEDQRIAVRSVRRAVAERMVKSKFTIPHVTEWIQIDATELERVRRDLRAMPEAANLKISPLPIVVKAVTVALAEHPLLNSSWDDATGEIVVRHKYHVGIATETDRGLMVPVVHEADQLSIFDLAAEIARLADAARSGKASPQELTGSTITVSSIGSFGVEAGTPIINHPEAAIVAPGVISKRAWVVDGQLAVRDVMTLSASFDHRVVDGAEAGRFLRDLGDLLEKPTRLLGRL